VGTVGKAVRSRSETSQMHNKAGGQLVTNPGDTKRMGFVWTCCLLQTVCLAVWGAGGLAMQVGRSRDSRIRLLGCRDEFTGFGKLSPW
jgi:hypothetical protein